MANHRPFAASRRSIGSALLLLALGATTAATTPRPAVAAEGDTNAKSVILPLTVGWFGGRQAPYISTEASDPGVALAMGANYVPRLANAANTQAVDDIYTITNFSQGNVIPSRPKPAGPHNQDAAYTPLWQVSAVTWNVGTTPRLLKSEQAILDAAGAGLVSIVKTNIVVNCSVIYTPSGGLLPHARLIGRRP